MKRKMARAAKTEAKGRAQKNYRENRELGACFLNEKENCQNNGDLITHCTFCDFKVQACTAHSEAGRNKAKKHLMVKHPAKTLPTVIMGVLGGRSLE
jgi:hypothetical protein